MNLVPAAPALSLASRFSCIIASSSTLSLARPRSCSSALVSIVESRKKNKEEKKEKKKKGMKRTKQEAHCDCSQKGKYILVCLFIASFLSVLSFQHQTMSAGSTRSNSNSSIHRQAVVRMAGSASSSDSAGSGDEQPLLSQSPVRGGRQQRQQSTFERTEQAASPSFWNDTVMGRFKQMDDRKRKRKKKKNE